MYCQPISANLVALLQFYTPTVQVITMFLNKRQQEEVIVIGKQIGCTLLQEQGSHVSRKLFTPVQLPSQLTVYNCISFHIRFAVNMLCSPAEMLDQWLFVLQLSPTAHVGVSTEQAHLQVHVAAI